MQTDTTNAATEPWSTVHPLSAGDAPTVAAMRTMVAPMKGRMQGIAARPIFSEIMGHVAAPEGVAFEADTVGGIPGLWCRPTDARPVGTILHLHGGWFTLGSSQTHRNLVGHIAARAGVAAFIPDYRLAPEHPFPSGLLDVQSCYEGLIARGMHQIAVVGDSAGGALGLALTSLVAGRAISESVVPVGVVALSPVTDLALIGPSWETRAIADPYFTLPQAVGYVNGYLGEHDPKDPLASPLYGDLTGLPPIRVQVGDDEMLLDDARRYVERAVAAGVDARLDVWEGMAHVFQSSVGQLDAADAALSAIGAFLTERLTASAD